MDDDGRHGPQVHPGDEALAGDPFGASRRWLMVRRRQRRWIAALWALAAAVVALAAVTVAVSLPRSGGTPAPRSSHTSGAGAGASSTTSSLPSGGLVITSLSPDHGSVGATVVVSGSGMVSPDGRVAVLFGTVVASTSCSSATTCRATVPSPTGGSPRVEVTVTTATGTSNPLPFTYQ